MGTLPASVRLALWATAAWNGAAALDSILERAFPDIDDVSGDLERLRTWPLIGERMLLCALPHPGHAAPVPSGNRDLLAEALDAGECVFVPMLGGALVPQIEPYGPEGDRGWQAVLAGFDCDPTPIHRVEMLTASGIERRLIGHIRTATTELDDLDLVPWQDSAERAEASRTVTGPFGLPSGIPGQLARTIWTSATVSNAAEQALEQDAAVGAQGHNQRQDVLRRLLVDADECLADATNLSALTLAGMAPGR